LINYLIAHPDVHIDSMDQLPVLDNYTNQYSTIKAIICKDAYIKGRLNGLREIMQYESIEAILKEEYGIQSFAAFIDKLKQGYKEK